MANNLLLNLTRRTRNIINHVPRRDVVNVPPTATGKRRFRLEVETDPEKLVNYCCGLNYHIDEPLIPLKPDNEYPDWLWELRLGPKPKSWELEKGTKEYYLQLAEEGRERNLIIKLKSANKKKVTGKVLKDRAEYLQRLRFAALAHMEEDDAGYDADMTRLEWYAKSLWQTMARDYYLPVDETKELFMDKCDTGLHKKALSYEQKESSFREPWIIQKPGPLIRKAIQDSKRRHRYSVY